MVEREETITLREILVTGFFYVAIYFLFFNPAFTFMGGLHTSFLLWPLAGLMIIKVIQKKVYIHRSLYDVLLAWLLVFLFILIRTLCGGNIPYLIKYFSVLIESVLVSYILLFIAFKYKINIEKALLITASIAGAISCICLFIPSINSFTKSILVIENDYLSTNTFRGFGIGDGFTFSYGAVLGLICAWGICMISKYRWFLIFIPIICGAIMINARTGIVPVFIAFMLFLISSRKVSTYLYTLLAVVIVVLLWQFVIIDYVPEETLNWILWFFNELGQGKEGGTLEVLQAMNVYPEKPLEWIFGTGVNAFEYYHGKRTDVGYQLQLFYGGIVFFALLMNFVFQLLKSAYKKTPKAYFITVVLSLLVFNYKGDIVSNKMMFNCFVFIMMYYAYLGRQEVPYTDSGQLSVSQIHNKL